MRLCLRLGVWALSSIVSGSPVALAAQSVADRTPNVDDGWTVPLGRLQFNFLHRFDVGGPPARKVTSFPNFHLATGLPLGVNAAVDYATNSTVFTGIPNEYQVSVRRSVLQQSERMPVDVAATAAYNFAPQSADGEISLGRSMGRVRVLGVVRGFSSGYDVQRSMWGAGGGLVVRVTSWLSLAGDVFDLVNAPDSIAHVAAWGGGAQIRIPYTPHSLSIQVTNTQGGSLEGASLGVRGSHMAGFEFTIPITLARYFGHHAAAAANSRPGEVSKGEPANSNATVVRIVNLAFTPADIQVRAGTRVRWVNGDQLQHTVTAVDSSFASKLIDPGASFEHTFDKPGTYAYHCTPHPFMTARVVVTP